MKMVVAVNEIALNFSSSTILNGGDDDDDDDDYSFVFVVLRLAAMAV